MTGNAFPAIILGSVGVGCLFGGLVATVVAFFVMRASSTKITGVITVATDQADDLRAEVVKLRQAIMELTEAVDEVLNLATPNDQIDPDAAWNLAVRNRAAKLAMR